MNAIISRDALLLAARLALSLLFIIMGWGKLSDYSGAVAYMAQTGAPVPAVAAIVAILAELGIGLALVLGVLVSPLAIALALYTVVTGFIGHHFWTMDGAIRYDMMIHFYKNISIAGGLVALAVAGPGRFALRLPMPALATR
ncbi:DoxX family protein [Acetobacter sacchari]|uniref:DoxX family protein n=1 Tax=Acetobacter sacchari TaxID=2661687 RepID=A0ABS3LSC7_9PROT|nr:DoxX family protein [Acetobacter sacchari]MBO1358805.1 DoxX family protein [Acetobacter sacchari]